MASGESDYDSTLDYHPSSRGVPVRPVVGRSAKSSWRLVQLALLSLSSVAGLAGLFATLSYIASPAIIFRDLVQEYLLGRAIMTGLNPYETVNSLAQQLLEQTPNFPHPTPHPPPVAILFLPFATLEYRAASYLWFTLEIIFLVWAMYLLARAYDRQLSKLTVVLAVALVGCWPPVQMELHFGQVTLAQLLLLVIAWLALAKGNDKSAGMAIGLALLLKPLLWPLLLALCLGRQWRALAICAATGIVGYGLAALVMGPDTVFQYFFQVLPAISHLHADNIANLSLWTLGGRLFSGTGMVGFNRMVVAGPVVDSATLATVMSIAVPLVATILASLAAWKVSRIEVAFSIMVSLSIVVNPLAWDHYFVLALIPGAQALILLKNAGFPRQPTRLAILIMAMLIVLANTWGGATPFLLTANMGPNDVLNIPPWLASLTLLPALSLGALATFIYLFYRRGVMSRPTSNSLARSPDQM